MFHIKHKFNNQASFIGIPNSLRKIHIKVKAQTYLHRPVTGPEVSRRLSLLDFGTVGI